MAYLNSNKFIGNFGSDIEVRTFEKSGDKIGRVSLAVTKKWTKEDKSKEEKTTWIPLLFPSHLVENAAKIITKGRQAYVEGEFQTHEYTKENVKITGFEFRVNDYQLLGPKPEGGSTDAE